MIDFISMPCWSTATDPNESCRSRTLVRAVRAPPGETGSRREWCLERDSRQRRKQVKRGLQTCERRLVERGEEDKAADQSKSTNRFVFRNPLGKEGEEEKLEVLEYHHEKHRQLQAQVSSTESSLSRIIHLHGLRRQTRVGCKTASSLPPHLSWVLVSFLALLSLLLLPNRLTMLDSPLNSPSIMLAHATHLDDESSSYTPASQPVPPNEEPQPGGGGSDSDNNYTQIPANTDSYASKQLNPASQVGHHGSPSSGRRASGSRRPSIALQVSEAELMPFADFNVQHPPFSDLMKTWPPTTVQAANRAASSSESHHQGARYGGSNGYKSALQAARARQSQLHSQESVEQLEMRSHLNEDFDDTIVTADQGFERDQMPEPPTWINYLGELGDYIYAQLRHQLAAGSGNAKLPESEHANSQADGSNEQSVGSKQLPGAKRLKIETIDEFLDDYYYDQYENSQVLYYGPQLVREGEVFEIGCYLPYDQEPEWTKSGRVLSQVARSSISPKVIRKSDYMNAKQNYSLKIFEASLSDSGNYRCNRMSRKYHKLVVAPAHATTTQLYVIQQRLLSVVNPKLVTAPQLARPMLTMDLGKRANPQQQSGRFATQNRTAMQVAGSSKTGDVLLPGYLIVESKPLLVNCNISDEFVLRRLRENPGFQLAWYKNGKQLKGSMAGAHLSAGPNAMANQPTGQQQFGRVSAGPALGAQGPQAVSPPPASTQRVQFLQANGRQLYISSAQYSDAGEYLCSWSKLPARQQLASGNDPSDGAGELPQLGSASDFSAGDDAQRQPPPEATIASTPLAAGSLIQLTVPVKLRPFKSTYHVRQGNQLRLTCQAQRGYPPAHISWYAGNQLIDAEFLRDHPDEFRILHLENQNQLHVVALSNSESSSHQSEQQQRGNERPRIVEVNPMPTSRQQMALTANGRGQWIEYRDLKNEKYAIETSEQQHRYMQMKLAQLTGAHLPGAGSVAGSAEHPAMLSGHQDANNLFSQASISTLVINSLNTSLHTSRYACRATTRANTDEVTTVIRVIESSTIAVRPSSGGATLLPGQPLHFECENVGNKKAQFRWSRKTLLKEEIQLQPGEDDTIEIHNERITLHKPRLDQIGDYICRVLDDENKQPIENEFAVIKVRTQPYIGDFGRDTSHTGRSTTVTDGDRLELSCTVHDKSSPVNITWLRSMTPDDEKTMVPLIEKKPDPENCPGCETTTINPFDQPLEYNAAPSQNDIVVEVDGRHSKRLIIESVKHDHRSYYVCLADNGVTERTRKVIYVRVKDKLVALWPFLGIVAQLFILFTIIHIWETQRAYKEIRAPPPVSATTKRPASGASGAFESVPLTSG